MLRLVVLALPLGALPKPISRPPVVVVVLNQNSIE